MSVKEKLSKCFKEGNIGAERHKGLRKIGVSEQKIKSHVEKAIHNLKAMTEFKRIGFSDWSASAAFYCLYHLLLALIAKYGYESRNQSCTFAFIEYLIDKKEILITKADLKEIFDKDVAYNLEHSGKILDIRENWQYSTKTILEEEEFIDLRKRIKELFDKLRNEIER